MRQTFETAKGLIFRDGRYVLKALLAVVTEREPFAPLVSPTSTVVEPLHLLPLSGKTGDNRISIDESDLSIVVDNYKRNRRRPVKGRL
jgi:hypothetical protein